MPHRAVGETERRASNHAVAGTYGARVGRRTREVVWQRPVASLLLLCALLLIIIWGSIAFGLSAERRKAQDNAMRETANRAQLFEDFVLHTLRGADESLQYLAAQYLRYGKSYDLRQFTQVRLVEMEPWLGIAIADEKGNVVLAAPATTDGGNVADRDMFKAHLAPSTRQPFIGVPHRGVRTGKQTLPISRRITRPDGSFAGVVTIGLDPSHFSDFQERLALGPDSTVTLVGRDGIVRARRSSRKMTSGQDLSGFPLFTEIKRAPRGSYFSARALDDIPRFFSYRALEDYPLIVSVGVSRAVAMEGYRRVAARYLSWAGLISVLTLAFAAIAIGQSRRQAATSGALRASEARYRSFISATSRITWTTDAAGRVVDDASSWRAYTGQSFDECKGDGWLSAVLPEDRPHIISAWSEAVATRSIYQVEYRVRGADGVYRPFVCKAVPVTGEDGEVSEWLGVVEDITSKKQAERERELLAMIVQHANDAIFSRDLSGSIVTWNHAAEKMFGYTAAEAIGRKVTLIHADDGPGYEQRNERIKCGEPVPPTEGVRRTKDGRLLNVIFTVFPVKNEAGAVVGAAAIVRDVTEERRSGETRALLAAIVQNANDAIISRTLDGTITSWNAAAERLFGYTAQEAIGQHIDILLREGSAGPVAENSERLRRGESIASRESLRRTRDGRLIPVVNSLSRIVSESGEVTGVAIVIRDISERKQAEAGLQLAARIYEHAAEGLAITDANNNIVSVNRAYTEITGYTAEEVTGRNPHILASGQHAPVFHDGLWKSVRVHGRWNGEVWGRRKNGERYCALLSITVVRDDKGEIAQHCWILMDVTARKLYEDELVTLNTELEDRVAERTRKLEHANKELSAFSYSVSHDLRAPIRAIQGYSTLLMAKDSAGMTPTALSRLKRIQDNAERMGQLIDDLLRLSRVSQRQLERTDFDLSRLAEDVVRRLRRHDPGRQIEITVQPGMMTNGDESLVRHVMENLLGNAWKFTSRTARPRIEVGSETAGNRDMFYVKDNGAGFDMQYAHKLFSAFQRLHHREEFDGTGIGLSIVHRVVVKHGGTVWAQAEVGRGAAFYFTLG